VTFRKEQGLEDGKGASFRNTQRKSTEAQGMARKKSQGGTMPGKSEDQ
jgi:hypothetical protein